MTSAANNEEVSSGRRPISERLFEAVVLLLVAATSLFVLVYVGFADGRRTYEQIHLELVSAQGSFVRNSIEKFVRDGLPLRQYVGFSTLAAPIIESEEVDALAVYDSSGKLLFSTVDKKKPNLKIPDQVAAATVASERTIKTGDEYYQVWIPLKTRFESVGGLVIYTPASLVTGRLVRAFVPVIGIAAALCIAFSGFAFFFKSRLSGAGERPTQIAYTLMFVAATLAVVAALASVYYDGVQRKAKASAETMSQRLSDVVEFGIRFHDIDGLDRAFAEYRRVNPELSQAALVINGKVLVSSPKMQQGRTWASDASQFEYSIELPYVHDSTVRTLVVDVPRSVVYERVLRSVKNFLALFVASAFLSGLFLQVGGSLRYSRLFSGNSDSLSSTDACLVFIRPVFFFAVFFDSLTYSFLPKFMQQTALDSGLSTAYASAPFTSYYLAFALSLIPAGSLSERLGPKFVTLLGLVLAAIGVMWLSFPIGLWGMTALRACAGIGQGMIFIGVQTYIFKVVPPERKTQGAAIIVFGFQAGLISGMALGSLLVNFLDPAGVFKVAGLVAIVALIYTTVLLPEVQSVSEKLGMVNAVRDIAHQIRGVVKSFEFLNALLCIGIPAKAILTGVVTFSIPLVLGQYGYRSEDIGQVIMLYGLGVVISSAYASKIVDRTRNTATVLLAGAVMSGLGLWLFGLLGSGSLQGGAHSTALITIAIGIVGLAHGLINAPVTTHVAHSRLASQLGSTQVLTVYRFVERGGHVAGPFVLSQLFLLMGQGPTVIGLVGAGVALLGVIFVINRLLTERGQLRLETAP